MAKSSTSSPTADSSPSQPQPDSSPFASPLSHPSLIPSTHPRAYRSCSSPRVSVAMVFDGPGKTLQAFKDECDINRIMKRYQQTGVIDHVNRASPKFGDLEAIDFQSALNLVIEAEHRFAALPAELRDRFGNDPARLLQFVENPSNAQEAVKLGLLDSPTTNVGVPQAPPVVAATAPVASPTAASTPPSP
nr:MAG: internal scaffolding protein [Microvirus sp.]